MQTALRQLIIDLDNLDATLWLFEPDIDLEDIRPKPFPHRAMRASQGRGVSWIVFASLRQATGPLMSHDSSRNRSWLSRGLNTSDKQLVQLVGKRVGACLRHQRAKGLVRSRPGPGQFMVWCLAC